MGQIFFLFFLIPVLGFTQMSDDFSDGDFTSNATWDGDTAQFEITATKQLRLNAPAQTDESYLSLPLSLVTVSEWEFMVILTSTLLEVTSSIFI